MNQQQRRFLAIAILVGGGLYLLTTVSRTPTQEGGPASPTPTPAPEVIKRPYVFAKRDVPRTTRIEPKEVDFWFDVREEDIAKVPEGVATRFDQVGGRIVVDDIRAREPVILARLALPEEFAGMSYHIAKGKRAVTIRMDRIKAVGGFIGQNDVVDILGSFTVPGGTLTKYVMQKVKILAINTIYNVARVRPVEGPPGASPAGTAAPAPAPEATPGAPPTPQEAVQAVEVQVITFELSPQDAERLILLADSARLYMVLRSPLDDEDVKVLPIDDRDVYIDQERRKPIPKRDIQIYRGRQSEIFSVRVEGLPAEAATTRPDTYLVPQEPTFRGGLTPRDFVPGRARATQEGGP